MMKTKRAGCGNDHCTVIDVLLPSILACRRFCCAPDVSSVISLSGEEDMPANTRDFDYYHGSGTGGVGLERGGDGVAVIIAAVPGTQLPMKTVIFYSGK